MASPFIESIYNHLGYVEDLSELHECGVSSTILGGRVPFFSLMFDRLFRDELPSPLFHLIKSGLDDAKYKTFEGKRSLVSLYDDRYYGDFCKMGMRLWFEDEETGDFEKTLDIDLIYTNDLKFNLHKIPMIWDASDYEQMLAKDRVPFKKDKVYIMRVESVACTGEISEEYFEYLVYFPRFYFSSTK